MRVLLLLLFALLAQAEALRYLPLRAIASYPQHEALATVLNEQQARLGFELAGRLQRLDGRLGQSYAAGASLAELDPSQWQIEQARAQAQIELIHNRIALSQAQLQQAQALQGQAFISSDALKQRESAHAVLLSELKIAQQNLASAALNLRKTELKAPFAGVVRERLLSVGDSVLPGQVVLEFAATRQREVRAKLSASQLASLQAAGKIEFTDDSGPPQALRILRISALVDSAAQTRDVILISPEPLSAGRAGRLRWVSGQAYLPARYLQQRDGRWGAFIQQAGKPVFALLPQAQAGRAVPVDWALDMLVLEDGRYSLGIKPKAKP